MKPILKAVIAIIIIAATVAGAYMYWLQTLQQPPPKPTGEVILTVEGKITKTNTEDGRFQFDIDMLENIADKEYTILDPWLKESINYTGVSLVKLLEYVGAEDKAVRIAVRARDDYTVVFDIKGLKEHGQDIMIAFKANGQYIPESKGGPLKIVLPPDQEHQIVERVLVGVVSGEGVNFDKEFNRAFEWWVVRIIIQ